MTDVPVAESAQRTSTWDDHLDRLVFHVITQGRLPESGASIEQTEMARWLRQQRRAYRANRLSSGRWDRLRAAPAAVADLFKPVDPLGAEWCAKVEALVEFVSAHRRMPAQSVAEEQRLANFVSRQLRNKRDGSLSAQRAQVLRSLPDPIGSRFRTSRDPWEARAAELLGFVSQHDRLPANGNPEEKHMAQWLYRQTDRFRSGLLSKDKVTLLRVSHQNLALLFSSPKAGDAKWVQSFDAVHTHVTTTGVLPSRSSTDPGERRMWRWMTTQLTAQREGKLSDDRLERLRGAHPVLSSRFGGRA